MTHIDIRQRRGLSLLEVILSIAILGGALATIGELIRIGARNAADCPRPDDGAALLRNEDERGGGGAVDLAAVGTEPLDDAGEWLCVDRDGRARPAGADRGQRHGGPEPRPVRPARFVLDDPLDHRSRYVAECAALDAQLKAQAKQAAANAKQTAGGDGGGGRSLPTTAPAEAEEPAVARVEERAAGRAADSAGLAAVAGGGAWRRIPARWERRWRWPRRN